MRFFFRSRQFKIIAGIASALLIIGAVLFAVGGSMSPQANVLGSIIAPFQKMAASVNAYIEDFYVALNEGEELIRENIKLRAELEELRKQVGEYQENEKDIAFYEEYLGLKDEHEDFEFLPATVLTRDIDDPFGSFTVNKGSLNGISLYDPVITSAGVVGYVSEVSMAYCKVTTVLNPEVKIAAATRRTGDIGVASGSVELAKEGQTRLYNLAANNSVTLGDYVVTSGGGIFPEGLMVGTVTDVKSEKTDVSVYAVVEPAADITAAREVMIITYFYGQGSTSSEK